MNHILLNDLLEQAGFVVEDGRVDWSCNYTRELEILVNLIVQDCAKQAFVHNLRGDYYTGRRDASELILKRWQLG